MGFYSRYILPTLIQWACSNGSSEARREMIVPQATGRVLEIGIGSGNNLLHYNESRVIHLTGIDPLERLWKKRSVDLSQLSFDVKYIKGTAEQIPAGDATFDTVVTTFTLCSVDDIHGTLKEIHRVLKQGGKLLYSEHGKSPDKGTEQWQNLINPLWRRVSGGCNLNRDIPGLMKEHGFKTADLTTQYMPGWRLTSYSYWGSVLKV
jgi:ubiquinone/menaquinone biosynthesis C-methylase UbiE